MKVDVQNDLVKSIRKLSKLKSICRTTSSIIKDMMVFKKGTTKRREKKLDKARVIRSYKFAQKRNAKLAA